MSLGGTSAVYVLVPVLALAIGVFVVRWWKRAMSEAPYLTDTEQQTAKGYAVWQAMAAAGPPLALLPFFAILFLACALWLIVWAWSALVWLIERIQVS